MDKDVLKVWSAYTPTVAMLDWSKAEVICKLALTILVFCYTARKWYLAEQRKKQGKSFEEKD